MNQKFNYVGLIEKTVVFCFLICLLQMRTPLLMTSVTNTKRLEWNEISFKILHSFIIYFKFLNSLIVEIGEQEFILLEPFISLDYLLWYI